METTINIRDIIFLCSILQKLLAILQKETQFYSFHSTNLSTRIQRLY